MVITGTNTDLGLNIAYRLIKRAPDDDILTIVVTSRTFPWVKKVIELLKKKASKAIKQTIRVCHLWLYSSWFHKYGLLY